MNNEIAEIVTGTWSELPQTYRNHIKELGIYLLASANVMPNRSAHHNNSLQRTFFHYVETFNHTMGEVFAPHVLQLRTESPAYGGVLESGEGFLEAGWNTLARLGNLGLNTLRFPGSGVFGSWVHMLDALDEHITGHHFSIPVFHLQGGALYGAAAMDPLQDAVLFTPQAAAEAVKSAGNIGRVLKLSLGKKYTVFGVMKHDRWADHGQE